MALGEQGLAGCRGGRIRRTPWGIRPPTFENFPGFLEELDDLADLFLGLLDARHVERSRLDLVRGDEAGAALAETTGCCRARRWRGSGGRRSTRRPAG